MEAGTAASLFVSLRDCGLPEQGKELCLLYHIPRTENPPYSCLTQWKNEKIKVQDAPEELTPCVGWGLQVTLPLNV